MLKETDGRKTLSTYSTMDYISLGAWIAAGNHGNGGDKAGKSTDNIKDARVLDMRTLDLQTMQIPDCKSSLTAPTESSIASWITANSSYFFSSQQVARMVGLSHRKKHFASIGSGLSQPQRAVRQPRDW